MDEQLMELIQWAQSPEAQPFLTEMGVTPEMLLGLMQQLSGQTGMSQSGVPGMGGQPTSMGFSGYGDYLNEWAMSNPNDPQVGNYVTQKLMEMQDPYYQMKMGQELGGDRRADDINAALAFMELGRDDLAEQFLGAHMPSGYGGLGNVKEQGLRQAYGERAKEAKTPEDIALMQFLSKPTPEVTEAYYDEPNWWERATAPSRHGKQTQSAWKKGLYNLLFPGLGEVVQPINKQTYAEEEVRNRFLGSGYGSF